MTPKLLKQIEEEAKKLFPLRIISGLTRKEADIIVINLRQSYITAASHYADKAEELVKALEEAVRIEENKYKASQKAADIHNNTDGVGVHFDYMTISPLPEWVMRAKQALAQYKL